MGKGAKMGEVGLWLWEVTAKSAKMIRWRWQALARCHFRSPCPRALHSCAKYFHFYIVFRLSRVYITSHLTTESFSQHCNLSAYHCTAGSPNRLPSLHTRFKVEHFMNVVPELGVKILIVGDCELVQLTPSGLREGYCAARYVMCFSEWNLFDASYWSAADIRANTLTPLRTR